MDLVYESRIERRVAEVTVEAWATGRSDDRGEISIVLDDYECGRVAKSISPAQARELAALLIELASKAERLSTRGFVGSKE